MVYKFYFFELCFIGYKDAWRRRSVGALPSEVADMVQVVDVGPSMRSVMFENKKWTTAFL